MYADRYAGQGRFSPAGLVAAVGINAAVIAALMFAGPVIGPLIPADPPIDTYNVPEKVEPEPLPPPEPAPRAATRPAERIDSPKPLVRRPADTGPIIAFDPFPQPFAVETVGGDAGGTGLVEPLPTRPAPVLVGPSIDPRHARDFQPAYPAAEQRADREGRVTVRVLVGADGRVRQVERVSATSDAFWRATQERALSKWRFRPATRDGVAEQGWRTMTVTFVLSE